MIRRLAGVGAIFVALFVLAAPATGGIVPAGPQLAFMEWGLNKPMRVELASVGADGSGRSKLVGGGSVEPLLFGALSWSSDGSFFAFAGFPRGHGDKVKSRIYLASADGTGLRSVPGTLGAKEPVLSPDGASIAFSRNRTHFHFDPKDPLNSHSYWSTTTWIVDLAEGKSRRLSPWRNGLNVSPTSFSPDGLRLALDRDMPPNRGPEILLRDLFGGGTTVLAREARNASSRRTAPRLR
jgi:Tol biopolymer transport system component